MPGSRSVSSRKPPRAPAVTPDAVFRFAADQAPQVMWIVNAKGAVTYLNQAWYELVGGMPPKWHGHEWGDVVDPADLAQMRERWKVASARGTIFEGTRRVRAQDGSWHTLSYKATPVFDESGLACWVGMDSDITEMMATQAALRFANHELEAFSYSVSHDLRSPLLTLQGFTAVLERELDGSASPKAARSLERIKLSVQHMGTLIDGLLTLSDVARSKLEYGEVDMSAIATEILDRLARTDPARGLAADVQPGLVAWADRRLITALLENLLGNAWKFTANAPQSAIGFVRTANSPSEAVFCIQDNGAGFDMSRAANLFNAFERLHSTQEFPGSGIGLATVHRVVTRHGGRVWAQSQPRKGSSFYFALPAK